MLSAVFVRIPRVESHPVSFRAEDKATAHNRVVLGSENPHPWAAANHTWGRGCNRGSGQASHCPLCRAFADPGLGLNLCPRTALMPEEHNPERVHQCMLCRTLA